MPVRTYEESSIQYLEDVELDRVAGALVVVLLWVYYSAQLFLFGAEFTKIYAKYHGSQRGAKAAREALSAD